MLTALSGVHRYETFGLHASWVMDFLTDPASPRGLDYLGPRQRLACGRYLRDAGICGNKYDLTPIGKILSETVGNLGWRKYAWPCMWTFLCANAPAFGWYAKRPSGVWTREELSQSMRSAWPGLSDRTLYNGLLELLGTLRDTPIGEDLGQGVEVRSNGFWALAKKGADQASGYWALFCAAKTRDNTPMTLELGESCQNSVGQVLGVGNGALAEVFESFWQPDLFTMSRDSMGTVHVTLAPGLTPEGVLRRWIADV